MQTKSIASPTLGLIYHAGHKFYAQKKQAFVNN